MQTSDYIASAAAFVSLLALAGTIWQGILARTHNRLSVRPRVVIINEREYTPSGARIRLIARNVGLGPAIIMDTYFSKSGIRLPIENPSAVSSMVLSSAIGRKLEYRVQNEGAFGKDYALPAGEDHILMDVEFPRLNSSTIQLVDSHLKEYSLRIDYKSLYEEKFNTSINEPQ